VAGVAAALALTRLMETLLFAVRPNDPATLAGVAALMVAVAAAASVIPRSVPRASIRWWRSRTSSDHRSRRVQTRRESA
jgi:hypothetical protein